MAQALLAAPAEVSRSGCDRDTHLLCNNCVIYRNRRIALGTNPVLEHQTLHGLLSASALVSRVSVLVKKVFPKVSSTVEHLGNSGAKEAARTKPWPENSAAEEERFASTVVQSPPSFSDGTNENSPSVPDLNAVAEAMTSPLPCTPSRENLHPFKGVLLTGHL